MIEHESLDIVYQRFLSKLIKEPDHTIVSRAGPTNEVLGASFQINPAFSWLNNPRRKLKVEYAIAELVWYLSRENRIEMIQAYAPRYTDYSDDGYTARGAYGYRWLWLSDIDQLQVAVEILERDPASRQAIVTMFDCNADQRAIYLGNSNDVPCTLSWQFLVRDNSLHMISTFRSQDVWLGLPYDTFVNCMIQSYIARELDVNVGFYQSNIGSLHVYHKNLKAAKEAASWPQPVIWPVTLPRIGICTAEHLVSVEESLRKQNLLPHNVWNKLGGCSVSQDFVRILASKWLKDYKSSVRDYCLKESRKWHSPS